MNLTINTLLTLVLLALYLYYTHFFYFDIVFADSDDEDEEEEEEPTKKGKKSQMSKEGYIADWQNNLDVVNRLYRTTRPEPIDMEPSSVSKWAQEQDCLAKGNTSCEGRFCPCKRDENIV